MQWLNSYYWCKLLLESLLLGFTAEILYVYIVVTHVLVNFFLKYFLTMNHTVYNRLVFIDSSLLLTFHISCQEAYTRAIWSRWFVTDEANELQVIQLKSYPSRLLISQIYHSQLSTVRIRPLEAKYGELDLKLWQCLESLWVSTSLLTWKLFMYPVDWEIFFINESPSHFIAFFIDYHFHRENTLTSLLVNKRLFLERLIHLRLILEITKFRLFLVLDIAASSASAQRWLDIIVLTTTSRR